MEIPISSYTPENPETREALQNRVLAEVETIEPFLDYRTDTEVLVRARGMWETANGLRILYVDKPTQEYTTILPCRIGVSCADFLEDEDIRSVKRFELFKEPDKDWAFTVETDQNPLGERSLPSSIDEDTAIDEFLEETGLNTGSIDELQELFDLLKTLGTLPRYTPEEW